MTITQEEFDRRRLDTHHAGRASSLEEAAGFARVKAGEFYGSGKDDLAKLWREVAGWLDNQAKDCRKEQKKYHA